MPNMVEFEEVEWDNLRQASSDTALEKPQRGRSQRPRTESMDRRLRHFASTASTLNNSPSGTPRISRDQSKETPSRDMSTHSAKRSKRRLGDYLFDELEPVGMGAVIITCFFVSGLVDAVAFNSWNCFVGMQTGNTVFAALGIGGQPAAAHDDQYFKSLVAIAAFMVGTLFFNFLHRWHTGLAQQSDSRRRLVFVTSFFIQTMFMVLATVLVQLGLVSNRPYISGTFSSGSHLERLSDRHFLDLAPIAFLAFQAAGQVCLSRVLSVIELPTIVLSTLYHDWTSDIYGTKQSWKTSTSFKDFVFDKTRRQQKRLYSIIALFVGALVGGEMYKSRIGMAGGLWLACALKLIITLAFALWPREKRNDSDTPV